ncbi:hypothetical protein DIPPA_07276 [Diplonema papillatum]|nr:hypothetical protein DIPPA_07276 [Diplonema papillatum]
MLGSLHHRAMSRSLAETLLAASADEIADALAVPDFDSDPGDEELKPLSNNDHPTAPATGTDTRTAPPPTLQPTPVHLIAKGAVSRDNKSPSVPGTVPALRTEGGTPEPVILARAAREGSGCFEDGHEGREQPHVSPCRSPSRSPHLDGHPASPLEHDRVRNEVANLRLFLEQSKRKEDLLEDELLTAQTLALRYKRQAEESLEASRLAESPTLKVKHLAASEAYEARYAEVQASHSTLLEPHDIHSAAQTPTGLVAGTMSFQQQEDHHHQQQSIAVPVPNLSVPNLSGNYEHVKLPLSRRHSSASVGSTPADTVHQPPDAMTPQEDAHHLHDDTHLHVTHATSVGQPLELRSTVEPHVVPCLGNPQSLFLAAESTKYAIGSHVASLEVHNPCKHLNPN